MNVVQLREITPHDVSAQLRSLADAVDAGEYGNVTCVGVALLGNTFQMFGYGDGINGDAVSLSVAALFRAGLLRFDKDIEGHGRE